MFGLRRAQASVPPPARRGTWSERLTDDNSLWLQATAAEEQGDATLASTLYEADATRALEQKAEARAALGYAAAARCSRNAARPALLERAARLFESAGRSSVRQDPWLACRFFELAAECYLSSTTPELSFQVSALATNMRRTLGLTTAM